MASRARKNRGKRGAPLPAKKKGLFSSISGGIAKKVKSIQSEFKADSAARKLATKKVRAARRKEIVEGAVKRDIARRKARKASIKKAIKNISKGSPAKRRTGGNQSFFGEPIKLGGSSKKSDSGFPRVRL